MKSRKVGIVMLLSLLLIGCSQKQPNEKETVNVSESEPTQIGESESTDTNITEEKVGVQSEGYFYKDEKGKVYYLVKVENNTEEDLMIEVNGEANDSAGNVLGQDKVQIQCIGAHETSIQKLVFTDGENIESVTYELVSVKSKYLPVVGNITYEVGENENKIGVFITNNNMYDADYLDTYILYFDNSNNLIGYENKLIRSVSECDIKPGFTQEGRFEFEKKFDHYEIYFNGYGIIDERRIVDLVDDDIELQNEFLYQNGEGSITYDFTFIKNNSGKAVELIGNAIAKDSDGNVLECVNSINYVLGSEQESYMKYLFEAENIASIEYHYSYYEPSFSESGNCLELLDSAKEGNKVKLTVVNNGANVISDITVAVIFFDEEGNIVDTDWQYVENEDGKSELGENEIGTATIIMRKEYSYINVAFESRILGK